MHDGNTLVEFVTFIFNRGELNELRFWATLMLLVKYKDGVFCWGFLVGILILELMHVLKLILNQNPRFRWKILEKPGRSSH